MSTPARSGPPSWLHLALGLLGGAWLGLASQRHYLATVAWDRPALRLALGAIAGALLGAVLAWGLARVQTWGLARLRPGSRVHVAMLRSAQ